MKIGILGGTFNPVHLGHVKMVEHVINKMKLDKIVFIPTYITPHKQNNIILDPDSRLEMLRLALDDDPRFMIEEYEIEKKDISYSIDTIRYLKTKYPEHRLYWILGADMLMYIDKWYEYRDVLKEIEFIALRREGHKDKEITEKILMLKNECDAKIEFCDIAPINISSSDIREGIKKGEDIEKLVHKSVEQYIINNSL